MNRLALRLEDGLRELVDPGDVVYVEARGADTLVRLGDRKLRKDVRPIDRMEELLAPLGFVRAHRSWLVNLDRVRFLRRRARGRDWELVLDPPVNRLVPVGRERLGAVTRMIDGA
jgi:DNA-binding LytR/AlgR family response regulator